MGVSGKTCSQGCHWGEMGFKRKFNPDGSIQKYKARLVVKGYTQQYWVDDNETFAPVSRQERVRAILALAAQKGWKVYQLDVKSNLPSTMVIFKKIKQPPGFIVKRQEKKVLKLKKALYGLLQAPRAWYSKVDSDFISQGFRRSCSEPTLYIKCQSTSEILILELYVDDLIVTGSNAASISSFKQDMMSSFQMRDLGLMNYFLGMEAVLPLAFSSLKRNMPIIESAEEVQHAELQGWS